MPRTDRRDVSRLFRFTGGASPAALSPTVHGGVNAKLPRGAHTGWLGFVAGLGKPRGTPSWRSAPLPAVPCRQMAMPPIRILALSPALAFHAAYRAGHRLPALPTGRASSLPGRPILSQIRPADQPPRYPETLAHSTPRETPIVFPDRFPTPSSFVSNQAGAPPVAKPTDSAITPTAGRQTTSTQPGQRLPPKVLRTADAPVFRATSVRSEYLPK